MMNKRELLQGLSAALAIHALTGSAFAAGPNAQPVLIGLDAEFEYRGSTSAEAIRHGIQIAIDEINKAGGVLQGRPLKLIEKANGSVPARSANNIREFANMPDLVAVFCGRFSPTVLEMLPLLHQLGLPLMNPWSAADGIVDNTYSPNYAFRLSLKDSWAANVMLADLKRRQFGNVGLLMLNTSWGRSTVAAAQRYQKGTSGINLVGTQWINWDDDEVSMLNKVKQLRDAGARALLLTANAGEASILSKAMLKLPESDRLPVVSHWGVTGGDLPGMVGPDFYKLDFRVVQTYSFIGEKSVKAASVISAHNAREGGSSARSIQSAVGVAHAYDLTHILARAIALADSTDRAKVRNALEKVRNYDGLIKRYREPFTATRHEALSESDVFLARYSPLDGALEKLP